MVKYKAVMYIYTPDLRLLHRKSIYHGVAKHVLWVPGSQAKVSQSASFPQSPKLKEVTATLQDVVIDKREEIKICGGGEMFDNRFKRIQNSSLF